MPQLGERLRSVEFPRSVVCRANKVDVVLWRGEMFEFQSRKVFGL